MFCSPLIHPDNTILPAGVRTWVGKRLSGPPPGRRERTLQACIYKVDRVGDFVLALSAVRLLLAAFGEDQCTLVVSEIAEPLARREFPRVRRIMLPVSAPSLLRQLLPIWRRDRRKFGSDRYERRVCLRHQRDLYNEVSLSWIDAEWDDRLIRATYPQQAPDGQCLELHAHQQLVATVTGRAVADEEILPTFASATPGNNGRLLVCPFASQSVRHLTAEHWIAALRLWRRRSRAPIDFCGAPPQAGAARALAAQATVAGLDPVDVVLPADIDCLLERIAQAGAVLAVESAAGHIATALDKPACIVTGGGTFSLCGPWQRSARQVCVHHTVPCYGCGWHCTQPEVHCLTHIPPATIAAALPAL